MQSNAFANQGKSTAVRRGEARRELGFRVLLTAGGPARQRSAGCGACTCKASDAACSHMCLHTEGHPGRGRDWDRIGTESSGGGKEKSRDERRGSAGPLAPWADFMRSRQRGQLTPCGAECAAWLDMLQGRQRGHRLSGMRTPFAEPPFPKAQHRGGGLHAAGVLCLPVPVHSRTPVSPGTRPLTHTCVSRYPSTHAHLCLPSPVHSRTPVSPGTRPLTHTCPALCWTQQQGGQRAAGAAFIYGRASFGPAAHVQRLAAGPKQNACCVRPAAGAQPRLTGSGRVRAARCI
eukprot:363259-Chlamydomonas_euryale.AAC.11